MIDRRVAIGGLAALVPGAAAAHSYRLGPISIGHAWMLPGVGATQAFVPLALAARAEPDALIGARSARAGAIAFRRAGEDMAAIELPPGRGVAMRPGALHLALDGLVRPVALGERVAIELAFRGAGRIEVAFWVEERPYGGGPPRER